MKRALKFWTGWRALGPLLLLAIQVHAAPYPFYDDFELGLSNWSAGGEWDLTESSCLSGSLAVTDSPDGNYPDGYNGSLTLSTNVDLSTASSPVLIFWHKMWIAYADYALVEISTDGGFSWSTLASWYSDKYLATWTLSRFDLSAYVGMQIKVRFRVRETNVNVSDGWYIDSVAIRESDDEMTLPYPFSDDFEGSLDSWLMSGCEWGVVESECLGGAHAITDSVTTNYPDAANSMMVLAGNIDLSSAVSPVLIFWHKMWIAYADYALVEVSTDGGVSWSEVSTWYSDKYLSTWTLSRFDLSDYVGMSIKIRFRVRETNVNRSDGWFIDKVEIRERYDEPTLPYPFSDDFENGLDSWDVSGCEWGVLESDKCAQGNAVTDSPSGSYPDAANSIMSLKGDIDLSGAVFPVLTFWHKYQIAYADYALVEISTDGGVSWSQITSWYSDKYVTSWGMEQFDLRAYAGMRMKIRFRLRETNVNVNDGWHIDSVSIGEFDVSDGDGIPDQLDNCSLVSNWCQRDTDGDSFGNICDPDLDNSGVVNFSDLSIMKMHFFGDDPDSDLNGDGSVSFADLAIMKSLFFGPPGPGPVPAR